VAPPREPIFLGRETYRRRRLIDAARILPVVGALLFLGPMLGSGAAPRSTALGGLYIFAVWFGLIVMAALLVRWLGRGTGGNLADPLEPEGEPPASGESAPAERAAR